MAFCLSLRQPAITMKPNRSLSPPAYNHTIYILMALQKRIKTILITERDEKANNAIS